MCITELRSLPSQTMNSEFWIQCLRFEYLSNFVLDGGSAVKFAVTAPGRAARDGLLSRMSDIAGREKYITIHLDARSVKLHLIDRLFYTFAASVDWRRLAYELLCSGLRERGVRFKRNADCELELSVLAQMNGSEREMIARTLKEIIQSRVFAELSITSELRLALVQLCLARIRRGGVPLSRFEEVVISWLTGQLPSITSLKEIRIHQKIARHNGRHILYSTCHLIRKYLNAGTVLVLDVDQYLITVPTALRQTDRLYYSPANTMDLYELLREFVDDIDEVPGLLLLVAAPSAFIDDPKRGVGVYQALKMRLWNDVRAKGIENPVACMVTLT